MLLGWRLAEALGIQPGDQLDVAGGKKTVVGIFSTDNVFGDSAGMFPLIPMQAFERQPSGMSLAFVKVQPGATAAAVARRVADDNPNLTTIRTVAEFGRGSSYEFIHRRLGATIVAVFVGALIVETMLLALVERTAS
jgi:putative ABC transport system permease protein